MNKLIIIGNGFDLAHGLKTSYGDFLEWYLKKIYIEADLRTTYSGFLVSFTIDRNHILDETDSKYFNWFVKQSNKTFNAKFRPRLFEKIVEDNKYKWVDIENLYFEVLSEIYSNKESKSKIIDKVKMLNTEFSHIRTELIEYLKEETKKDVKLKPEITKKFCSNVEDYDNITILNFNYTETASYYKKECLDQIHNKVNSKVEVINIHGQLKSEVEEPIFGIGDEHHKDYIKMKEDINLKTLMEFSKSFWYQRNDNYKKMVLAVTEKRPKLSRNGIVHVLGQIDVEIYGHSCGLSDRTLLKYIFENDNVNEIKLIHYGGEDGDKGKENYIETSYEIWRHFDNPQKYREKLISYDHADMFPN